MHGRDEQEEEHLSWESEIEERHYEQNLTSYMN